jgi:hypothetical protein
MKEPAKTSKPSRGISEDVPWLNADRYFCGCCGGVFLLGSPFSTSFPS